MNRNKIFTLTTISIVGVGVLLTFIFILSDQNDPNDIPTRNIASSTEVVDDEIVELENGEETSNIIADPSVENDGGEKSDDEAGVQGLDGIVYDAFVEYLAPKGHRDSIDVQLSLDESGVVVNANVEYVADNEDSKFYQSRFESAYKDEVIGKKIEDIDLSRVGGASLTSAAFMKAVTQIKGKM